MNTILSPFAMLCGSRTKSKSFNDQPPPYELVQGEIEELVDEEVLSKDAQLLKGMLDEWLGAFSFDVPGVSSAQVQRIMVRHQDTGVITGKIDERRPAVKVVAIHCGYDCRKGGNPIWTLKFVSGRNGAEFKGWKVYFDANPQKPTSSSSSSYLSFFKKQVKSSQPNVVEQVDQSLPKALRILGRDATRITQVGRGRVETQLEYRGDEHAMFRVQDVVNYCTIDEQNQEKVKSMNDSSTTSFNNEKSTLL